MNFLEGLRRLFLLFSLAVVAVGANLGWLDGAPPPWCKDEIVKPANSFSQFGPPKTGHEKQQRLEPFTGKLDAPCNSTWVLWGKSLALGAGYAAAAAVIMLSFWLCLRWIIVGFFPSASRQK